MLKYKIPFVAFCLLSFSSFFAQKTTKKLVQPPYLQKGDTITIVAPAGNLRNKEKTLQKAKTLAESWGLKVILAKHLFSQSHYFAGSDKERCQDFQKALDNPNIKAIWAARGGYGSVRILDKLNFTIFKKHPKWIIGYSDITVFHNHIHHLGVETIQGMMPVNLEKNPKEIAKTIYSLKKALFGKPLVYKIPYSKYNRKGIAKGQLIGGNITILTSLLGSKSQISTDGKILFIEEIGEYKYQIDRMLQSLKRAGYFSKVKGIIVGDMTRIKKNSTPWGSSIEQLILNILPKNIPVLFNFPAGHQLDNRAMIFGRNIVLKVEKKQSLVLFEK